MVRSVGGSEEGLHLDTADTSALLGSDLDVTFVTPGSAPGVSDDVVVLAGLGSVSDGSDGVVEVGAAGGGVEDTRVVKLEDGLVSLDGDGDDALVDGSLELVDAVGLNLGPAGDLDFTHGLLGGVASSG